MTDVDNLDDLARAISNSSSRIKAYALAQAAATQAQEVQIRKLAEDVEMLRGSGPTPRGAVPAIPVNFELPAVEGTFTVGSTLTAYQGGWTDSPTSYAYQWYECDSAGLNCASIGGATNSTYVVTSGEIGSTFKVTVAATNALGTSPVATSSASAVIPTPTSTFKTRFQNISAQSLGDDASFGGNFYQHEKFTDRANITTLSAEKVLRTRCAVGDTDVAGSGTGNRCEIMRFGSFVSELSLVDTESIILRTEFYLDPTFSSGGFLYGTNWMAWNNFVQFHHGSSSGQVPFQLNLCTDDARLGMRLIGNGPAGGPYYADGTPQGSTVRWYWTPSGTPYIGQNNVWNNGTPGDTALTHQVSKSTWHTLVISLKFDQSAGYARVWLDGVQRFNVADVPIGYVGDPGAYWKQGFYRANAVNGASPGPTGDSILYWRDLYSFNTEAEALSFVP